MLDGSPGARAHDGGFPGLAVAGGAALAERIVLDLARQLCAGPDWTGYCVGVGAAGALSAPAAAADLAVRLAGSLPGASLAVTSDAVIAHAGAAGGAPAVVAALGTGVTVLGLGPTGVRCASTDGDPPSATTVAAPKSVARRWPRSFARTTVAAFRPL
jgi:hypothetical protein